MTTAQMAQYLDKTADYALPNGLTFLVIIIDVRMAWGRVQFQITPSAGQGPAWVSEDSIADIRDQS